MSDLFQDISPDDDGPGPKPGGGADDPLAVLFASLLSADNDLSSAATDATIEPLMVTDVERAFELSKEVAVGVLLDDHRFDSVLNQAIRLGHERNAVVLILQYHHVRGLSTDDETIAQFFSERRQAALSGVTQEPLATRTATPETLMKHELISRLREVSRVDLVVVSADEFRSIHSPTTEPATVSRTLTVPDRLNAKLESFDVGTSNCVIAGMSQALVCDYVDQLPALFDQLGSGLASFFEAIDPEFLRTNFASVQGLVQKYGYQSFGFFAAFETEALEVADEKADFFDFCYATLLKDSDEDQFGSFVANLTVSAVDKYEQQLRGYVIETRGDVVCLTGFFRNLLHPETGERWSLIDDKPELIERCIKAVGGQCGVKLLGEMPDDFGDDEVGTVFSIIECVPQQGRLRVSPPFELIRTNRAEVEALAKRRSKCFWALVKRFGSELIEKEREHSGTIDQVTALYGDNTSDFLSAVAVSEWESAYRHLHDRYGVCAGRVVESRGGNLLNDEPQLHQLEADNQRSAGLTRMQYYSGVRGELLDVSILVKNREGLSGRFDHDRGFAVAFVSPYDRGNVFYGNHIFLSLKQLLSHYNLFVFETETVEQISAAHEQVKDVVEANGLNPFPGFSFRHFEAHGNKLGAYFGPDKSDQSQWVRADDPVPFTEWSQYMKPGGFETWSSCHSGDGAEDGRGLLAKAKAANPNVTVMGYRGAAGFDGFLFDPDESQEPTLIGIEASCAPERIVIL